MRLVIAFIVGEFRFLNTKRKGLPISFFWCILIYRKQTILETEVMVDV